MKHIGCPAIHRLRACLHLSQFESTSISHLWRGVRLKWMCTVYPLWSHLHYGTGSILQWMTALIFHVISRTPSKEMQLDTLLWLLLLFVLHFHAINQVNRWAKEPLMKRALTQNRKEARRNTKVERYDFTELRFSLRALTFFYSLHIQQSSSLISAGAPGSRCSHFNVITLVWRTSCLPTITFQSTSIHLRKVDWPNSLTVHFCATSINWGRDQSRFNQDIIHF